MSGLQQQQQKKHYEYHTIVHNIQSSAKIAMDRIDVACTCIVMVTPTMVWHDLSRYLMTPSFNLERVGDRIRIYGTHYSCSSIYLNFSSIIRKMKGSRMGIGRWIKIACYTGTHTHTHAHWHTHAVHTHTHTHIYTHCDMHTHTHTHTHTHAHTQRT